VVRTDDWNDETRILKTTASSLRHVKVAIGAELQTAWTIQTCGIY
jgi:hypothetical protein